MNKYLALFILVGGFLFTTVSSYASISLNSYVKSEWSTGYCYKIEIKNTGLENIDNWKLYFNLNNNLKSSWSGNFTRIGDKYEVTGVSYNKVIKKGKTKNIGFCVKSLDLPTNIYIDEGVSSGPGILFEKSFSDNWLVEWAISNLKKWGIANNTIVINQNILKVKYPAGSYKPSGDIVGGAGFLKRLDSGYDDVYLSYDFKFDENFEFIKGGKLPGLCGGNCTTGSGDRVNGFSTRFMWRTGGDAEVYAYISDKDSGFGTSLGRGAFTFVPGEWYNLTQRVRLNTVGQSNGVIEYFVDGVKVYSNSNLEVISNSEVSIDGILFSTFFGGGDPSWATPNDTYSYFKNFKVYR